MKSEIMDIFSEIFRILNDPTYKLIQTKREYCIILDLNYKINITQSNNSFP